MKMRLTLILTLLLFSVWAIAQEAEINGVFYNFDKSLKTASVTFKGLYADSYDNEYSGNVIIPTSVEYNGVKYNVTKIENNAFYKCSTLSSITIPEGVTEIGYNSFYMCGSLATVTMPVSTTSIKDYAFYSCSNLTSITIPENVTMIGSRAFMNCENLSEVIFNAKSCVTKSAADDGVQIFTNCNKLTTITFGNNVTELPDHLFESCIGISDIAMPENIKTIGSYTFSHCTNLVNVTLPKDLTSINSDAFSYCSNLTKINIPKNVSSIGSRAFEHCINLNNINIPQNANNINMSTFYNTAIYNNENNWDNGAFYLDNYLIGTDPNIISEDYVIKDDTKAIMSEAFKNCMITSVTIPSSVTKIHSRAFESCSNLTSITIPEGTISLGDYVFCIVIN